MKLKQKKYIRIAVFATFVLITGASFALIANANVGYVDTSGESNNKVKVCRDVACANPGIINFENSGGSPLVIDTEKGISGKVLGGDLGWITFNPPYGGVFFADANTGLLKGTAWSETSGAINFSVTGQKVVIDPKTGEWNGWAWASGPYGGWVKFDCKDASCVRTIWRSQKTESSEEQEPTATNVQSLPKFSFLKNFFNQMVTIKNEMVDEIAQKFSNTYNSVAVFLTNIFTRDSLVNKNEPPVVPSTSKVNLGENKDTGSVLAKTKFNEVYNSIVSNLNKTQTPKAKVVVKDIANTQLQQDSYSTLGIGEEIKMVMQEKSKIISENFNTVVASSTNLFNKMTETKSKMFDKAGDTYYFLSSNLMDLRSSVLKGLDF